MGDNQERVVGENTLGEGINMNGDISILIREFTRALQNNSGSYKTAEPSTYNGTRDALFIDSWLRSIERFSEFNQWENVRTKNYALTLLRGRAEAWYRSLEVANDEPTDWATFKQELIDFFRPENSRRLARDKLQNYVQTGSLVDYINGFMDIIVGIPGISDDESCDRFMRGLQDPRTRCHIRQINATTLKAAVHAAISFDSAQFEHIDTNHYNGNRYSQRLNNFGGMHKPVPPEINDPMELDALDFRSRNQNRQGNNGTCFYCGNKGHRRANCRIRIQDIKRLDNERFNKIRGGSNSSRNYNGSNNGNNNRNYGVDQEVQLREHENLPLNNHSNNKLNDFDNYSSVLSVNAGPLELQPIIYEQSLTNDLIHITELHTMMTNLPVYEGLVKNRTIKILIDSGASENYVSPNIAQLAKYSTMIDDRQVETAGGQITEITEKVHLDLNLNGFHCSIQAYVFPTKFDLILGRSWLTMIKPKPDWSSDTWLIPDKNNSHHN
ncbi:hypothetical protein G6F16_012703 [Rhizopus arrhizus]|nr:hypothetical protein G6F16_012703 [Rhizopus arrhizus]KAG0890319.1 hypothetical protein G6F34_012636 [Rhizopus arrhizus]KAG1165349.1 hypothetical protein G6F36_013400 [Rhizopus arrhizus]